MDLKSTTPLSHTGALLFVGCLLCAAAVAGAEEITSSLLLDIGTEGTYGGSSSPAHEDDPLGSQLGSNWNGVGTSDVASGLVFHDGTPATGISIDVGVSTSEGGAIDWDQQPSQAEPGFNDREFESPLTDLVKRGGGSRPGELAYKITGLPASPYRIYAMTAEVPSLSETYNIQIGKGLSAFTSATGSSTSNPDGEWDPTGEYVLTEMFLSPGDDLVVITDGVGITQNKLSSIEFVSTPEPTGALLLLLVGLALLSRRNRF
jgi:hypothetical protein